MDPPSTTAQAVKVAESAATQPTPEETSAKPAPEPRANVMFDNHTFYLGSLSEVREWIATAPDEDFHDACLLSSRWSENEGRLISDHRRPAEPNADLRVRWLAIIDRVKAEIAAAPPVSVSPLQQAMALKIAVRSLRMLDDSDVRAMDRICHGIDALAARVEGRQ